VLPVNVSDDGFLQCAEPQLSPSITEVDGIFVAGVAAGPKDIPDSIVEASAAAMQASIYLRDRKKDEKLTDADQQRLQQEILLSEFNGK
jgi:heterodisulfide reductase subunit A